MSNTVTKVISSFPVYPVPRESTSTSRLRLVLQPGGAITNIDKPVSVLGRSKNSDVRLPLPDVTRTHAEITLTDNGPVIRDLGSLNGTYVNGKRVEQSELKNGDLIRIGSFTFLVELPETPQS